MPNARLVVAVACAQSLLAVIACGDGVSAPSRLKPSGSSSATRNGIEAQQVSSPSTSASVAWNEIARNYVAALTVKPNQQANLRGFAYLSLAQYKAVVAANDEDVNTDEDQGPSTRASAQAAVAGASATVLTYLFPAGAAGFEAAVRAEDSRQSDFAAGEAIGRAIGASVIALAKTDRFDAVWTGTVPVGPCLWTGTNPLLPLLGQMRPFFLESGSQFRPPPPPSCQSAEFKAALAEVRQLSDTRTPEQLAIAQYWAGTTGSLVAGLWNAKVSDLITKHRLSERRAARALALTNMAAMDANIACHDGKYAYWFIRPFQADPAITTPIGRPNHPSYPSNHACVSGTFAYVLGALLPSERDQLAAQAQQAAESRLYAGIHYRFDRDAGLKIARQVTAVVLRRSGEDDGSSPLPEPEK
jgi:membrane-associated phospholipid phosphatase